MISCEQHDYVEIACMYNYVIRITLKSGKRIEGVALDVKRNESRQECLKIKVNNIECLFELDSVSTMEAVADNPHFKVVSFN